MVRFILAVVLGLAFGTGVVYVGELAQHALFPRAPGEDPAHYLRTAPFMAPFALVVVWIGAAAIGAFAAGKVARSSHAGWIAGGLLLAATCLNFTMFAHPLWMIAGTLIALPIVVWAAARAGADDGALAGEERT